MCAFVQMYRNSVQCVFFPTNVSTRMLITYLCHTMISVIRMQACILVCMGQTSEESCVCICHTMEIDVRIYVTKRFYYQ